MQYSPILFSLLSKYSPDQAKRLQEQLKTECEYRKAIDAVETLVRLRIVSSDTATLLFNRIIEHKPTT